MSVSVNENGTIRLATASIKSGNNILWYIPDGTTMSQIITEPYVHEQAILIDTLDLEAPASLAEISQVAAKNIMNPNGVYHDIEVTNNDSIKKWYLSKNYRPSHIPVKGNTLSYYPQFAYKLSSRTSQITFGFELRDHCIDIYMYINSDITDAGLNSGRFEAGTGRTHALLLKVLV